MKLQVFSIFDIAVEAFMTPFYARAKGEAVRMFSDLASDRSSNVGKHPMDFVLMHVGEFDDRDGRFMDMVSPVRILSASECIVNAYPEEDKPKVEERSVSGNGALPW